MVAQGNNTNSEKTICWELVCKTKKLLDEARSSLIHAAANIVMFLKEKMLKISIHFIKGPTKNLLALLKT